MAHTVGLRFELYSSITDLIVFLIYIYVHIYHISILIMFRKD